MALAACTQQPAGSPAPSATATPVAQRGAGGELKILYWQEPTILNAHQATGTKDNDASRLVLEPLASWDKNGQALANGLAAEIPTVANGGVAKDFTSVTWKLRTGVKWSDGTPFTADDVVGTYTYMCDEKTAASTVDVCEGVKSVTAKDPNTAVVTYAQAQPFYFQWGVGFNTPIIQKAQYANCLGVKAKDCPADLKPIGTGPYKVNTFKPGDVVQYDLNENFRDPNKPFFKTVTLKGGGDAASAARAVFQTGDVDYAWNLQVEANVLKPMAQQSSTAQLTTVYGSSVERILINFSNPDPALGDKRGEPDQKHPFFSDIAVRRALAMASDRKSVAEQLYGDGLSGKASCNILTAPEPMNSKNSDGFDDIVDQLRKETDSAKRNQLAIQANDLLIKDVVVIPLINRTFATSGVSKSLKGVDPTPWDSEMYNIADWTK